MTIKATPFHSSLRSSNKIAQANTSTVDYEPLGSNSSRNNQIINAQFEFNLSGGEGGLQLDEGSLKLNYNLSKVKLNNSSTSNKDVIGGITLRLKQREEKPVDPNNRIEVKTEDGKGAVRADEGKDALHFKFKTPLPETAVIMAVRVSKGGKTAIVKYDKDGNLETKGDVFVKTATLSPEAPE
ncbi:MAG: hypothetical protein HEQ32_06330 [Vampirovibrio sp.]